MFATGLLTLVRPRVFYAGDNGLKALVTTQFASGVWSSTLRLPAEPWVERVWSRGFYPFEEPFVYDRAEGRVVQYPPLFAVLSAPFFWLVAYPGLYVLPFASLVALGWRMGSAARRMGLSPTACAIAHAGWASSYLIIYGAIFWEHLPATTLAFLGVARVVESLRHPVTRRSLAIAGGLLGVSAWLRPECLLLALVTVAVWWPMAARREAVDAWCGFAVSTLAVVAGFLLLNLYVYGHPLGAHGIQVVESHQPVPQRLLQVPNLLWYFAGGLAHFAPMILTIPCFAVVCLRDAPAHRQPFVLLVTVAGLTLLATALIVPNEGGLQWGPRYVTSLVPLLVLAVAIGWDRVVERRRVIERVVAGALIVAFVVAGVRVNWQGGWRDLSDNYTAKASLQAAILAAGIDQVVVSDQFIAQEMAALFGDHRFYLVPADDGQPERLTMLAEFFAAAGRRQFLFVSASYVEGVDPVEPRLFDHAGLRWSRRALATESRDCAAYVFTLTDLGSHP